MLREGVVRNLFPFCCGSYRVKHTCPACGKVFRMSLLSRLIRHLVDKVAGSQVDYDGLLKIREEDIDTSTKRHDRFKRMSLETSRRKALHRLETYKVLLDTVLGLIREYHSLDLKIKALKCRRGDADVLGQDYRNLIERTLVQVPGRHGCPELGIHPH